MRRKFKVTLAVAFAVGLVFIAVQLVTNGKSDVQRVAIIAPIEHEAIRQIAQGFTNELKQSLAHVQVEVLNAQGDPSLQRAIFESVARKKYALIAPIGTDTSLMAMHTIKTQPIVCLDVSPELAGLQSNATGLIEADGLPLLAFARELIPDLKRITLVHSAAENMFRQAKDLVADAKAYGIEVQQLMIHNLADLYTIADNIDANSQLLFVLKDHLVVSGISTLARTAATLQIPLYTSDEGSIRGGGAFALGNHEAQIGSEGAKIATKILRDQVAPSEIAMQPIANRSLFISPEHLQAQGFPLHPLIETARAMGYQVERFDITQTLAQHP